MAVGRPEEETPDWTPMGILEVGGVLSYERRVARGLQNGEERRRRGKK